MGAAWSKSVPQVDVPNRGQINVRYVHVGDRLEKALASRKQGTPELPGREGWPRQDQQQASGSGASSCQTGWLRCKRSDFNLWLRQTPRDRSNVCSVTGRCGTVQDLT